MRNVHLEKHQRKPTCRDQIKSSMRTKERKRIENSKGQEAKWLAKYMVVGRGGYDGTKKGGPFLSVHNTYIHQAKEKKEQFPTWSMLLMKVKQTIIKYSIVA